MGAPLRKEKKGDDGDGAVGDAQQHGVSCNALCIPVGAGVRHAARAAVLISEEHHFLTQDLHTKGLVLLEVFGQRNAVPTHQGSLQCEDGKACAHAPLVFHVVAALVELLTAPVDDALCVAVASPVP